MRPILLVGVPFVWLGAVLAISFLEAPLKFRAPGITIPLGLGIGRLVFRALNLVELALAATLTAALLAGGPAAPHAVPALLVTAWALLATQVLGLRPALGRRARRLLAGEELARSWLHPAYVTAEVAKVVVLATLGGLLVTHVVG